MKKFGLNIKYQSDLFTFYKDKINGNNTLILENNDHAANKINQSMVGISCAIKIFCQGQTVTVKALNSNGECLITKLNQNIEIQAHPQFTVKVSKECLTFQFLTLQDNNIDERNRIQQINQMHVLRLIQQTIAPLSQILFSGIISFDYINNFEKVHHLKDSSQDFYDYVFYLFDVSIYINHNTKEAQINAYSFDACEDKKSQEQLSHYAKLYTEPCHPFKLENPQVETNCITNINDEKFKDLVQQARNNIKHGDAFQIVLSRKFLIDCKDPLLSFAYLKEQNPSPYMFYVKDENFILFGTSPEFALKVNMQTQEARISPIAGTRARGVDQNGQIDKELDSKIELELRTDSKEIAEHIMLVDLARNDLARISKTGSTITQNLLHVDKYQSVQHLVSDVYSKLDDDFDAFNAYLACMNMGTLSGAPKIKAHQLIYQYEQEKRGAYGGVICKIDNDGSFDSAIVIRSAFVKGQQACVQAGCGITVYSTDTFEANETRQKARSTLLAISKANYQYSEHLGV